MLSFLFFDKKRLIRWVDPKPVKWNIHNPYFTQTRNTPDPYFTNPFELTGLVYNIFLSLPIIIFSYIFLPSGFLYISQSKQYIWSETWYLSGLCSTLSVLLKLLKFFFINVRKILSKFLYYEFVKNTYPLHISIDLLISTSLLFFFFCLWVLTREVLENCDNWALHLGLV